MRPHLLSLLALLVAVAGAGCAGGGSTASAPEALSAAELGWVRAYSVWTIDVYDEELGPDPGAALVRECRERLDEVGRPPTKRLEPAAERAASACPLLAQRGSLRRALDVVDEADDLVLPFFLESQVLQLRSGATNGSRADVDLSELASGPAETAVEVRCWSPADWRRVVGEDNAWNDEADDAEELFGWQDEDAGRIHMHLDQCNTLLRLRPENLLAWDRDEQVEAADSLVTLAHEIQHFVLPDAEEAEVECGAVRALGRVARQLGAAAPEMERLVRLYRTEIYPELPAEYRGNCKG